MLRNKAGASGRTDPGHKHQKPKLGGWRAVSFIRVVTKSTSSALTLPAPFVRQHGHKFQKFTVLQSAHRGEKSWTVEVGVNFPHGQPQVILFNGGWKAFAAGHSLVQGDRLGFTLVAMNRFQVSVLRCDEKDPWTSPKKVPRLAPNLQCLEPRPSSRQTVCIDLTREEEPELDGRDASNGAGMSSSSDMGSQFFENLEDFS